MAELWRQSCGARTSRRRAAERFPVPIMCDIMSTFAIASSAISAINGENSSRFMSGKNRPSRSGCPAGYPVHQLAVEASVTYGCVYN